MQENTTVSDIEVTSERSEVIKSIEGFVASEIGNLLKPVSESWQPADFLPRMDSPDWRDQISELQKNAALIPDDLLVVLIGDMVTEEALPTYQTWLSKLDGMVDPSGISSGAWAQWSRGWSAEENRHGDLLNRYLYLSGRVDMHAVEMTVHHLIKNGFDPRTGTDPYLGFIYTSFQERATKISHRNVARLAQKAGEEKLNQICGFIAGDEARHERAYKLFMEQIFRIDPANAVESFATMMKRKIGMPAQLMHDGNHSNLFASFSRVAQHTGVYTVKDYAEIIEDLVNYWRVGSITGLSDMSAKAQDYLCTLADRYRKLIDRVATDGNEKFSWIFDREISLAST